MTNKLNNPFKVTELINAVNELDTNKQDTLVSGTNIKTINGSSILGNGNLTVTADTNDCVHKTGDETINGVKTFNNAIHFKSGVFVDAAANNEGGEIAFAKAPNSLLTGDVHLDVYENSMRIFGPASNGQFNNVIKADIEQNALFIPSSDKTSSAVSTVSIYKSQNGYVKLGNGLIIQWGAVSTNTYQTVTITFPISFTNTYSQSLCQYYSGYTGEYNANFLVYERALTYMKIEGQTNGTYWIAVGF